MNKIELNYEITEKECINLLRYIPYNRFILKGQFIISFIASMILFIGSTYTNRNIAENTFQTIVITSLSIIAAVLFFLISTFLFRKVLFLIIKINGKRYYRKLLNTPSKPLFFDMENH